MSQDHFISTYQEFDDYRSGGDAFGHRVNEKNKRKLGNLFSHSELLRQHSSICPYCQGAMSKRNFTDEYMYEEDGHCIVYQCNICSYWNVDQHFHDFQSSFHHQAFSVQKKFPLNSKLVPINVLNDILKKNPDKMHLLHYTTFEKYIGDLIKVEFGNAEVLHMGKSNDGGIDLVLIISDSERILVQCKRRESSGKVEGVETVRTLLGTLLTYNELKGVVVSTADYFSYHAHKLTQNSNIKMKGYEIQLYDKGKLQELINQKPISQPWNKFFLENLRDTGLAKPKLTD